MKIVPLASFPRFICLFSSISLAFALAGEAQTSSAQQSPPLTAGAPESVGMSSERLARIDTMLEAAVARGEIPGAVALVARRGKIVYHKAFGLADNTQKQPMKPDAIFRIASQSKAVTATAVMMLWEEGRFGLGDPISRYIPEFKNPTVLKGFDERDSSYTTQPADQEITIRHLLTHTSGLGYGTIDSDVRFKMIYAKAGITDLFTTEAVSIGDNVKKLAKLPLHHHPGEAYVYSEGLDVLGYLVEVISGQPFDVFLQERLFDPLGMDDTWFYLPEEKADRLVTLQTPVDGQWQPYPVTFYDPEYPVRGARQFFSGGAGLSSTAEDYANFLQMYLNGGELNGIRILSRPTVEMMMVGQTDELFGGNRQDYGLAFAVLEKAGEEQGRGSEGSFFWGGYFNTQYFADPEEQLIGIILKQTRDAPNDNTGGLFGRLVRAAIDD